MSTIQVYVCVYRNNPPKERDLRKTTKAANSDPVLSRFLAVHSKGFYDWGDDPAFFSAQTFIGDVRRATWGVCRTNVRRRLDVGDVVIFFCSKQNTEHRDMWDYYYIGVGTVDDLVIDRRDLWTEDQFVPYRKFYNVLTEVRDGDLIQKETFHSFHKDWRKRSEAPYVLFAEDPDLTHFNLTNPLHVATYDGSQIPEVWNSQGRYLENLLFVGRSIRRRLRTSPTGFGHVYMNLSRSAGSNLNDLRNSLLKLSEEVANR